jgi:uncharacterized delta-60 repeat protein
MYKVRKELSMNLAGRSKLIGLLVRCAFLAVPTLLMAQAGSLDPTFGINGIATSPGTTAAAAALQSEGKIVVVGSASNGESAAVLRYNTNGTLDSTFGSGGQVTLDTSDSGSAFAVAIQSDGNILVAAPDELELGVFRLNGNGSLDTSFGSKGVAIIRRTTNPFLAPANGTIALQADGKILVVALSPSLASQIFARLLSNGTTDSTFGTNGAATLVTSGQALALQPRGEILVLAGLFTQGVVSRYGANGRLDPTFGGAGQAAGFGIGGAMTVIESNSEFIVAGSLVTTPPNPESTSGFLLVRYKANGNIDTTFGSDGVVTTSFPGNLLSAAAAVALQSNGDIVAGGSTGAANSISSDFALARYTASGTLDITFGTNGRVTTAIGSEGSAINTLLIQTDGKILAFGSSSEGTSIARYRAQ